MIYRHLRYLRETRHIKQAELAQLLHVAQNTYSQYETGKIALTAEMLERLADFYQTSVDYLLDRTEILAPYPKP